MKKLLENSKIKIGLLSCGIILIIVLIILAIKFLLTDKNNQKKELTELLTEMSSEFYEDFYYNQIGSTLEEKANFLKKYETIGIKINLDNLSRYNSENNNEKIKKFINEKTKKECNKDNTKAFIYPKDPYEKGSYKIEIVLDCGFDKK